MKTAALALLLAGCLPDGGQPETTIAFAVVNHCTMSLPWEVIPAEMPWDPSQATELAAGEHARVEAPCWPGERLRILGLYPSGETFGTVGNVCGRDLERVFEMTCSPFDLISSPHR